MRQRVRIVHYAVNGAGTGHLTRLTAMARWLRRYATIAQVDLETYFLTSSEADALLFREHLASFKVPSKTAAAEAGLDELRYRALAKQWIWHSLGLLQPDLLVVDTWPRGAFGELLSALDLTKHRAFVYRPVKKVIAASPDFQAMLPIYDLILVPETEEVAPVLAPEAARARILHVGPIMCRERSEMLSRAEARARLGIAADRLAVLVSAGGGGDPHAERQLLATCDALRADAGLHLVVGAGPLYRGRVLHGERVTWIANENTAELLYGMDLAVCGAGYNTFHELMFAGVPTIFVPQEKLADEQSLRAERAVQVGAARLWTDDLNAASLGEAMKPWWDAQARAQASAAARSLIPNNCARAAAAALLRLILPSDLVEQVVLATQDEQVAGSAIRS